MARKPLVSRHHTPPLQQLAWNTVSNFTESLQNCSSFGVLGTGLGNSQRAIPAHRQCDSLSWRTGVHHPLMHRYRINTRVEHTHGLLSLLLTVYTLPDPTSRGGKDDSVQATMAEPSESMAELTPQQVYEVITAAVGLDPTTRRAAESTLKAWETDAAPGLFGSLIKIVQEGSIDEVWWWCSVS